MAAQRRQFTPEFTAKVAVDAVRAAKVDKLTLWAMVPEPDGGTIYDLRVEDFVEIKRETVYMPPNKALLQTGAAFWLSAVSCLSGWPGCSTLSLGGIGASHVNETSSPN